MVPLVSVVIPTFNRAQFVCRAIESVLNQTHTRLEIFVCDDGSTDQTTAAIERQFGVRPEIRLLQLPHSGLPAVARNAGLCEAKGEFVAFLDSDDYWLPDRLQKQLAVFEQNRGLSLVCSNATIDGDESRGYFPEPPETNGGQLADLLRVNFVITSSVLARRQVVEQAGRFREEPALRAVEDYDLWLRMAMLAPVCYLHEPLVVYRDAPQQSIRGEVSPVERQQALMAVCDGIAAWAKAHGRLDRVTRERLTEAIRRNNSTAIGLPRRAIVKLRRLASRVLQMRRATKSDMAVSGEGAASGLKLHLGCGQVHLPGYLNIDFPLRNHSVQSQSRADLHADILTLSYEAGSIDEVRLHHVFEHFQRPIALSLLVRWYEWLHEGGRLVLETPDFERSIIEWRRSRDERRRQRILRHLFGSHEAAWASHYDGWYPAKFQSVLGRLGFCSIAMERSRWQETFNVTVTAVKRRPFRTRREQLGFAEDILRESLIDDSESERRLLSVWMEMLERQLG